MAELIIALGIMSIVMTAIYGVSAAASRSSTKNEVAADVIQNLRTSMDYMEQDIRMAGSGSSRSGRCRHCPTRCAYSNAIGNSFIFYSRSKYE